MDEYMSNLKSVFSLDDKSSHDFILIIGKLDTKEDAESFSSEADDYTREISTIDPLKFLFSLN